MGKASRGRSLLYLCSSFPKTWREELSELPELTETCWSMQCFKKWAGLRLLWQEPSCLCLAAVGQQPARPLIFHFEPATSFVALGSSPGDKRVMVLLFSVYPSPWSCHGQESLAARALRPRLRSLPQEGIFSYLFLSWILKQLPVLVHIIPVISWLLLF